MRNHLKELAFSDAVPHFSLVISRHSVQARENKGTEREIQGIGWDMSISLLLFLAWVESIVVS